MVFDKLWLVLISKGAECLAQLMLHSYIRSSAYQIALHQVGYDNFQEKVHILLVIVVLKARCVRGKEAYSL